MKAKRIPVELLSVFYFVCWIPYIAMTRDLAIRPHGLMTRPLAGLSLLPVTIFFVGVFTYIFFSLVGWWKFAHQWQIFGIRLPRPTIWTAASGLAVALLLVTVPLSFTFPGVSIPFIQLLTRGDVLVIAPAVDWMNARRIRWFSWVALALVIAALLLTLRGRHGLHIPFLCGVTVFFYVLGYFVRLQVMSRLSKSKDQEALRRFYVEEQLVAYPLAVVLLAVLGWSGGYKPLLQIRWGFVDIWSQHVLGWLLMLSLFTMALGLFAAFILLDERENTFCVALERSASVLGGLVAAYVLAKISGMPMPTSSELMGALILVGALVVLTLGPHISANRSPHLSSETLK
jgi:hypothetical protein